MNTSSFFRALYGEDIPQEARIELWSKDDGSRCVRSAPEAADAASCMQGNAYFGVCLTPPVAQNRRADAASVLYAPALWVDVDVLSPHHSKQNLPPNDNAAYSMLMQAMPLSPSAIIATGGGLHAYWFLDELWPLDDDADRVRFAAVIKGWQGMLRKAFRAEGWDLDATHDLARVMRIPGTWNYNANTQSSITFCDENMRYALDDFEQFTSIDITEAEAASFLSYDKEFRHIHVIPRKGYSVNEPLVSRVSLLCDCEERFRASFEGRNPLLADDSLSTLDASLAFWMAFYDAKGQIAFTDQDIADVLVDVRIRHARKNKDLRKASRVDYLQRTIAHARQSAQEQLAAHQIPAASYTADDCPFDDNEFQEEPEKQQVNRDASAAAMENFPPLPDSIIQPAPPDIPASEPAKKYPCEAASNLADAGAAVSLSPRLPAEDEAWNNIPLIPEAKQAAWEAIGALMGLWVYRAVCYINTEPKELRLVVQPRVGGSTACVVMNSETLLSRAKVKAAFFDATGRVPTCLGGDSPMKAYQWELQAEAIMDACPMDKMPEEATEEGLLRIFLKQYVAQNLDSSSRASTDLEEAASSGRPFMASGHIHVNVTAFSQFLRTHGVTEWGSATKIAKGFLRLKMRKRVTVYVTSEGKRKSITGYTIPDNLELELAADLPAAESPEVSSAANIQ